MPNGSLWRHIVHAYVECRARGGAWWLFANPVLPPDEELADLLVGAGVDEGEEPLRALGVPRDASVAVRDEFTWRVAGPSGGDAPNIVSVGEAEEWIARKHAELWPTSEGFARVTDPRWSNATWLDANELASVLSRHEQRAGEPAPAAYCALLAMMRALERDYVVRAVMWLERRLAATEVIEETPRRVQPREIEQARAAGRPRRARPGRRAVRDS
jgi:hypothetical protein